MNKSKLNGQISPILSVSLVTYKGDVKKIIKVLESLKQTPIYYHW